MSEQIKTVPVASIVSDGWLQEANRKFFHPRGAALSYVRDTGGYLPALLRAAREVEKTPEGLAIIDEWLVVLERAAVFEIRLYDDGIEFGPSTTTEQAELRRTKAERMHEAITRAEENILDITRVEDLGEAVRA